MRVLILGGTGMLGHVLFSDYLKRGGIEVYATVRTGDDLASCLASAPKERIVVGVDASRLSSLDVAIQESRPDVAINCIGIVKHPTCEEELLSSISVNAVFPHRLSGLCRAAGVRLIHIGTDGVFDGRKGQYREDDGVNATGVYGMTKFLGEVNGPDSLTLRTSIIGRELKRKTGLVEWFLAQNTRVKGYTRAMYSGLPTIELSRIIADHVLPNVELSGVYHVSSEPISKYDLLFLIAKQYGMTIEIEPSEEVVIDRSLDSTRFQSATVYVPKPWPALIEEMFMNDHNRAERDTCSA